MTITFPDVDIWKQSCPLISRALLLMELANPERLQAGDVARRLEIPEDTLTALFRKHLSATPDELLTARQKAIGGLVLKTMSAVKGSPRASLGSSPRFRVELAYQSPYDWEAIFRFLERRLIPGVEELSGNIYRRTFSFGEEQGIVEISHQRAGALTALIDFTEKEKLPEIIGRLRRMFDLSADPALIARRLGKDITLAPLVKSRPGLRLPGAWDAFELAIRAILGQQITVSGAIQLAGKAVARFGAPLLRPSGKLTHVFPRPDHLIRADFGALGMPATRANTLRNMAEVAAGTPA